MEIRMHITRTFQFFSLRKYFQGNWMRRDAILQFTKHFNFITGGTVEDIKYSARPSKRKENTVENLFARGISVLVLQG